GKSSANIVFLPARRGAEDAAQALSKKHGVRIEAVWLTPSREDATVQAATIRKAVAEGMGAILVACSDAVPLTPAINEAVARGVSVMTFDSDAPASKRFAFYGADDADVGDKVMTDLARLLSEKGKVAVLAGNASAPNLRARVEAVRKAAARYPEIEIVDVVNHEETPQDAATAVLTADAAHPDLDGWAMVGGWALFRSSQSLAFAEDLHKRGLRVVAVDALPEELSYIERGLVPVLWGQPIYLWGQVGVETIVDHVFFGKTVPERIRMELVRVTRESLGSWARKLKSWGFTSIPEEYLRRQ
ncbi:MAG TPA: substrate-binding domain-containing protein, partial [Vicinamibacteria bacterium]